MRQFAERHPSFPQQTTGDQFFDEAQFEAYRQLGEALGVRLRAVLTKQGLRSRQLELESRRPPDVA